MAYISDLHCHPSFKPYNNQGFNQKPDGTAYTIWDDIPENTKAKDQIKKKQVKKLLKSMAKDSQTNLDLLVNNGVRSVFCVIHPIERGWFNINKKSLTVRFAECLWDFVSKLNEIGAWFTGIPIQKIKKIREDIRKNRPLDYYLEETVKEYQFLQQSESVPGLDSEKFSIATNYQNYKNLVKQKDTVVGIITIEGGHALNFLPKVLNYTKEYKSLTAAEKKEMKKSLLINIERIKGVGSHSDSFQPEHAPLFISLAHFYNNFLVGHAKSYTGVTSKIFNQSTAINQGFTTLGRIAINKLLNRNREQNERRILIDVKHMSLTGRKQYYRMVKDMNIPIIFSHGAVTGYSWKYFRGEDNDGDHQLAYFSHMSINLYNEDIQAIVDSNGLIGLATHEGRMPGGIAKKQLDEIKRRLNWNDQNFEKYMLQQRQAYLKLFMGNIFQIIMTVNDKKAWDHVCIGSDYDGIMDPFDRYPESDDFNTLLGDILMFLKHPIELQVYRKNSPYVLDIETIKQLMFGISPRQLMSKLAYQNVENFLSKYFSDDYRLGPATVPV